MRKNASILDVINLYMYIYFCIVDTIDASVIISPSHDYTTFENNASTFIFNCSGNGTNVVWTVGSDTISAATADDVFDNGIQLLAAIVDGLTVSSQLIVPTTKANNNTTVKCTVLDSNALNHLSSDLVTLFLQGTTH